MADAVRGYLQHLVVERGLAANTVRVLPAGPAPVLRRCWPARGKTGLGEVTPADVAEFLASLREGDDEHAALAVSSAARAVIAVRGLHAFAVAAGPRRHRPGPRGPAARRRPGGCPRRSPWPRWNACSMRPGPGPTMSADPRLLRDRALLEFLYGTGARISEATGLDVDELRLDADPVVRLVGKGGKHRVVPVGSYAVRALEAYLVRAGPPWPRRPAARRPARRCS